MRHNILDHGYVDLVEAWGSDERIIESARMSTGKGFLGWGSEEKPGDEKLLKYLWTNKHHTPFEMAGAMFEIQAPIFIFREWHRHRTQSYNEMSARYMPLPDVNYIPSIGRIKMGGGHLTKQAAGTANYDGSAALLWHDELSYVYSMLEKIYQQGLAAGVPKEIARIVLPVGRYSKMRASTNLRNWLAFLSLRDDPHAQWEIQQYAAAVKAILVEKFPRTMEIFEAGR